MSTLLKWAQNTTQGKNNPKNNTNNHNNNTSTTTTATSGTTNGNRNWIHSPDALQKGHIAYLVKFLGYTVVDQPKGIEVVKEGIRKLRFTQQLKKSETGAKMTRKVELTISADGVAIQEPRTHTILHQFPLHRISYCADDKGEKKFFSFIAKQAGNQDSEEEKHECFVFISDKLAEEITLTIGQAFELAYRRFLETSGKDLESQRRVMVTQQRIKRLEHEITIYKKRLLDLSQLASVKPELDQYLRAHELKSVIELPTSMNDSTTSLTATDHVNGNNNLVDLLSNNDITNGLGVNAPPVPPRNFENQPSVGTKLEGLLLNEIDNDQDFDPRSFENNNQTLSTSYPFTNSNGTTSSSPPLLAPPPKAAKRQNLNIINNNNNGNVSSPTFGQDLFGSIPFRPQNNVTTTSPSANKYFDPFGMDDFSSNATPQDIENAIGLLDKRILEMKTGFSRGICFGNEDFSLESLDPLKN